MKKVWEALIYGTQLHFWNSGSISISISISKILTINDFQITFRFENQQFVYTYTLRIMLRLYSMIKGYTEKHDIVVIYDLCGYNFSGLCRGKTVCQLTEVKRT